MHLGTALFPNLKLIVQRYVPRKGAFILPQRAPMAIMETYLTVLFGPLQARHIRVRKRGEDPGVHWCWL